MYIKSSALALALSTCFALAAPRFKRAPTGPQGIDVSGYQPNVDWTAVKASGVEFAYIKATESTTYTNPEFASQYNGAYDAGLIRGAYHFAQPADSSGADQANYFLQNGGRWSNDGKTLPGALDMEYAPSGDACYGLDVATMTAWIADFVSTYQAATTRYPVIYTSTSWWTQCTGNSDAFGANSPLWVARYADEVGDIPAGWATWTIWQYADSGPNPGDQDVFNGDSAGLTKLASG
ncbi:glycoside hydrolase family 25 protein [Ceratobasidium sp. AG-I]|nr:glycoside hydrolase family 25 protein [Ceratobasidium sp. AG-I]